jgi:hypothetical protein
MSRLLQEEDRAAPIVSEYRVFSVSIAIIHTQGHTVRRGDINVTVVGVMRL